MEPPKWRIMGIFAAQKLRERRQSAIFFVHVWQCK